MQCSFYRPALGRHWRPCSVACTAAGCA
jgi:hypothetical protein